MFDNPGLTADYSGCNCFETQLNGIGTTNYNNTITSNNKFFLTNFEYSTKNFQPINQHHNKYLKD